MRPMESAPPKLQAVSDQPTPQERLLACGREIGEVLKRHGCFLFPKVSMEPVGDRGDVQQRLSVGLDVAKE